jgi:hypothetical protein
MSSQQRKTSQSYTDFHYKSLPQPRNAEAIRSQILQSLDTISPPQHKGLGTVTTSLPFTKHPSEQSGVYNTAQPEPPKDSQYFSTNQMSQQSSTATNFQYYNTQSVPPQPTSRNGSAVYPVNTSSSPNPSVTPSITQATPVYDAASSVSSIDISFSTSPLRRSTPQPNYPAPILTRRSIYGQNNNSHGLNSSTSVTVHPPLSARSQESPMVGTLEPQAIASSIDAENQTPHTQNGALSTVTNLPTSTRSEAAPVSAAPVSVTSSVPSHRYSTADMDSAFLDRTRENKHMSIGNLPEETSSRGKST